MKGKKVFVPTRRACASPARCHYTDLQTAINRRMGSDPFSTEARRVGVILTLMPRQSFRMRSMNSALLAVVHGGGNP